MPNNKKEEMEMEKITPFLWFDTQAEEAANFYVAVFSGFGLKKSKVGKITRYSAASSEASQMPEGSVMTVEFQLAGRNFTALNGGPMFKFSGAVSFVVNCQDQEEVDYFWEKLSAGGEAGICGWINHDKYGVTWQIVPVILTRLMQDQDAAKAERVTAAMLKMTKIDIAALERAAAGNN